MEKTNKVLKIERKIGEDLESFLIREYSKKYKTTIEVGEMINVGSSTISYWLRQYNIPIRDISKAKLEGKKKPSKEELEKLYIKEHRRVYEIAELVGVTTTTIYGWLREFKIPRREYTPTKKLSREELEREYVKENKTTYEIGAILNVDANTIRRWLIEYGIPRRTSSEIQLKGKRIPSKEKLKEWYNKDYMSINKIAKKTRLSPPTIQKLLGEYGIKTRTLSEAGLKGKKKIFKKELERLHVKEHKNISKIADMIGVGCSTIKRWLIEYGIPRRTSTEIKLKGKKKPSKKILEGLYIIEDKNTVEIGKIFGVSYPTIKNWLKQCNIPIKSNKYRITSQSQYKSFLEKNPTAKKLSALASSANGLSGAVLDRLIQLYPNELKRAQAEIPKWIESLGKYLGPYTLPLRGNVAPSIDALLTDLPEQMQDNEFQQILFSIMRDNYMQQFNENPKEALKSLEISLNNENQSYAKELFRQVYGYYSDVYNLEIPGIKPLST